MKTRKILNKLGLHFMIPILFFLAGTAHAGCYTNYSRICYFDCCSPCYTRYTRYTEYDYQPMHFSSPYRYHDHRGEEVLEYEWVGDP